MYNHNTMNSHDARTSSPISENDTDDGVLIIGIPHHQEHAQHAHHKRCRSSTSRNALLCILAAALCANTNTVNAFAPTVATTTSSSSSKSFSFATCTTAGIKSKSTSALDISSVRAIPHSLIPSPSLADMMGEVTAFVEKETHKQQRQQQRQQLKKQKKQKSTSATTTTATATSTLSRSSTADTTTTTTTATAPLKSYITNHGNGIVVDEEEVRRRKLEWAGRYTTVEALRQTFGANQNKLWGDMQASTARRLYKTLLPRALLELSQLGVGQLQPQDLAPLAYQARVAAKLYARERCTVPARIGATVFDGFRQWMKYGKFQAHGMTYDQLWEKYADKIVAETQGGGGTSSSSSTTTTETDVCLKILERSCVSNASVDQLVLKNHHKTTWIDDHKKSTAADKQQRLLERIHAQLEQDMYQLLLPKSDVVVTTSSLLSSSEEQETPTHRQRRRRPWSKRNHVLMVRLLAKQRRLMQQREQQQQQMQLQLQQQELQEDDRSALRPY